MADDKSKRDFRDRDRLAQMAHGAFFEPQSSHIGPGCRAFCPPRGPNWPPSADFGQTPPPHAGSTPVWRVGPWNGVASSAFPGQPSAANDGGTGVIELTEKEKRFLKRVDTITHVPWSNKVTAADAEGKPMRIARATFARLRDDGIIIRSTSDLTSNTYVINSAPVTPQVAEVQEAS
ncbi:MAG: hypothetical protein E5X67_16065 [Mesorhizobium sp.]|uniref:hypothetical protein n=1 Tax=Mesorhizobium sp. TaxID=1871066 RepID=UPI0011F7E720|nr:hypothetical protein [Mesorhizobium sp.]TIP27411.1 MAG: hypothetical protein E5X67_16065 [Mesorhizobium sp.]